MLGRKGDGMPYKDPQKRKAHEMARRKVRRLADPEKFRALDKRARQRRREARKAYKKASKSEAARHRAYLARRRADPEFRAREEARAAVWRANNRDHINEMRRRRRLTKALGKRPLADTTPIRVGHPRLFPSFEKKFGRKPNAHELTAAARSSRRKVKERPCAMSMS